MKKIIELVKYQIQIFFKGSRFIMPFVTTAIYLFFLYSNSGDFVGSMLMTCYFVFLLMVWIGFSVSASESPTMEQIIFLRVKSNVYYYMGKTLFLVMLGFIINSICLIYPIIINLLNQGGLFQRTLSVSDILNAFILLCGSSLAGSSLGSFFHPRVMKDRRMAILMTVLFLIVTVARTAIINGIPLIKIIIWILPPLDSVSKIYRGAESFQTGKSLELFCVFLGYAIIWFILKSLICYKRKF